MVLTGDETADELAEAIGHANTAAKRQPHVMGDPDHPSRWDIAHRNLDAMLDDWLDAVKAG